MVTGVIMASGFSNRMKKDKLLMEIAGKPLIERVIESCKNSGLSDIILIYRKDEIRDIGLKHNIKVIKNEDSEKGQSQSVKLGAQHADLNSKGIMFLVGDQPFLDSLTIDQIIMQFEYDSQKIIVPIYGDRKGSPTIFPSSLSNELEELEGDIGGRDVIDKHQELVKYVEIENHRAGMDMDTQEDYKKLKGEIR